MKITLQVNFNWYVPSDSTSVTHSSTMVVVPLGVPLVGHLQVILLVSVCVVQLRVVVCGRLVW